MAVATAVAFFLLAFPGWASAATGAAATQTQFSIWPEYDDPRVLVIMQADLTPDTPLPTQVSFNIPKDAEIGMACEVDGNGGHACKPYQLEDHGDYQTLTYTVDSQRKVFLEYYYEAFPAAAGQRDFTVNFRPAFPTGTVTFDVKQPARATGFTLDPEFPQQSTDSEGLTSFTSQVSDLPVDKAYPISISYTKPDANPSVQPEENSAAGGGSPASSGKGPANTSLLIVVAAIAFALLLFVGYRSLRPAALGGGRSSRAASRGGRRESSPNRRAAQAKGNRRERKQAGRFCTQCGEGLEEGDRFCSSCGHDVG